MKKASQRKGSSKSAAAKTNVARRAFRLTIGSLRLPAVASSPDDCRGWVVCASSQGLGAWTGLAGDSKAPSFDILNRLHESGFATLEVDLVDRSEKDDQLIRFDIPLLSRRLLSTMDWVRQTRQTNAAKVAFLATGNAAGAALWCTAQKNVNVAAVVSLQGRPHLAEPLLGDVTCPTLLLVEGNDPRLLQMNQQAEHRLNCPSRLVSVLWDTPRERKEAWKTLSREAIDFIGGQMDRQPSPAASLLDFVRIGWAPRFKRQFLSALAFLSFSLAVPQTARTDSGPVKGDAKKTEAGREKAARSGPTSLKSFRR